MEDEAAEWRLKLMESVAENDEELIEIFLETGELSEEQLKKGIREGVLKHGLVPVLCGSAFKNKGVQLVLDAVVDYLPYARVDYCMYGAPYRKITRTWAGAVPPRMLRALSEPRRLSTS